MATLFVYDNSISGFTLRRDFCPGIGWSDERFLAAAHELCSALPLALKKSFFRPAEGCFSPHWAGLAGDFFPLSPPDDPFPLLGEMRLWCVKSGLFSCVLPGYLTPFWIHAEVSVAPPCSTSVPYPPLFPGNIGPHVFILQECLNLRGFPCLMSGRFSRDTAAALSAFCTKNRLLFLDVVDAPLWRALVLKPGLFPGERFEAGF